MDNRMNSGDRIVRLRRKDEVLVGRMMPSGGVELLSDDGEWTGCEVRLDGLEFLAPTIPTTLWCVGKNYPDHAMEMGGPVPQEPCVFLKPLTALMPHEGTVRFPAWAGQVDYEGELAVVIGRHCKNLSESQALDVVGGYTCFNDVTARGLQRTDLQWARGKGFDGFAPIGPCLLLAREMPEDAVLRTRLNGGVVQESALDEMVFGVARIISFISRFATLRAGDVIAMGTPAGVGALRDGDEVEVEIDGIGVLRNRFESFSE